MHKQTLQELNLIDDFLFNKMVSHPEYGEEFSRELLGVILGKKIGKLHVIPQKIYYGSNTDRHGTRLDVFMDESDSEEMEDATIYDVEPESEYKDETLKTLARRARFYHSKIDAGTLKSGLDYSALKNVFVIFIMPKDPLGANRMMYTIESRCLELPELQYDDGAKTIFLYTQGTEGNPEQELQDFLKYMENSCAENAKNDTLKRIHSVTERIKSNEEVSLEYMKIYEKERWLKEEGRKLERANTERERKRAEKAEAQVKQAEAQVKQDEVQVKNVEAENARLKEELARLKK